MHNSSKSRIPVTSLSSQRSCSGCTKCCEGWLTGVIDNEPMYPGRPCKYVKINDSCSIYSDRPFDPCIRFTCEWLINSSIPEWLSPSFSNVIIAHRNINDIPFYDLCSTGQPINDDILSWYILWGTSNAYNISWTNRFNHTYYIGSQEFTEKMSLLLNKS